MQESEAEKPSGAKPHGCLVAVVVVVTLVCLACSLFYALVWYVPGDDSEARKMVERGKARHESALYLPADQNGWKNYVDASKKLDLNISPTPSPSPAAYASSENLNELVESGINPKNIGSVRKIAAKNQDSIKLAMEGHRKKTVCVPDDKPY
jgi:hypothetical protein